MDPVSNLVAVAAVTGVNLATIIAGYVRIAERLARIETQVADLATHVRDLMNSQHGTHSAPDR